MCPANITILRGMDEALDYEHPQWGSYNAHIRDLVIVGFFWLLRPAEYLLSTDPDARSQAFLLRDIHLTIGGKIFHACTAPLNEQNPRTVSAALCYC